MSNRYNRSFSRLVGSSVFIVAFAVSPSMAISDNKEADAKPQAGVVDMIVAQVEGEPITMSDMRNFLRNHGVEESLSPEQLRKQLKDYIFQKLIEREAEHAGISIASEEIDSYIVEVRKQNNLDDVSFTEQLKKEGLTLERYRAQLGSEILRSRVIGSKVRARTQVTEEDIDRFMEEHNKDSSASAKPADQSALWQLYMPADSSNISRIEAKMSELRAEIIGGRSMQEVGGAYFSDLGDLKPSDLREELSRGLVDVPEGVVSPVIKTGEGVYLFQTVRGAVSAQPSEREAIRQKLTQSKMKEELDRYFNDELLKKYDVEILM